MTASRPLLRYRFLSILLFFFWVFHALWHAIINRQPSYVWQRFGLHNKSKPQAIWMHASSVGEVELLKPLLEYYQSNQTIVLTTFTATGYQHALRILPQTIQTRILPIDFYPISRLFFDRYSFKLGIIAETELWPETIYQARQSHIPLLQINARLSEKSLQTPRWIRPVLEHTLRYFERHLTRSEQDKSLFISMGVEPSHIKVAGNLKYARPDELRPLENLIGRPYILFASTHNPEEKLFAELMQLLDRSELTVIAPRHPARAREILKSLKTLTLNIKQRSLSESITDDTQLYLADTLGELKALMAHATLVVMGGSFAPIGGHNILEPARLGKAIITGPSDDNIKQDISFLRLHEAIIQVDDIDKLGNEITRLLDQPEQLDRLAKQSAQVVHQQNHVLDNYLKIIGSYLKT